MADKIKVCGLLILSIISQWKRSLCMNDTSFYLSLYGSLSEFGLTLPILFHIKERYILIVGFTCVIRKIKRIHLLVKETVRNIK